MLYCVQDRDTGELLAVSDDISEAMAYIEALYAPSERYRLVPSRSIVVLK